jgi:hypothetical protein
LSGSCARVTTAAMLLAAALVLAPVATGLAVNYYVSPSGDDLDDGLSEAAAWCSIDRGDELGILAPGDTVNILPGDYLAASTISLTSSGTGDAPIVYAGEDSGGVRITSIDSEQASIQIDGDNLILSHVSLTADALVSADGIQVNGDSCVVRGLYIHDIDKRGVTVDGSYNLFFGNTVAFAGEDGIRNEGSGEYNTYYNNTVYSNAKKGFDLNDNTSRVFNNIVVLNDKGIDGNSANVCGFNDVWGNTGSDYGGGVADSAGGLSADPQFFDPVGGDFRLQCGSPAIDAGLDLGCAYYGDAPDMGAVESDYCDSIAYIVVMPDSATVLKGASLQYAAYGYAADSTFVIDLTDSAGWATTDNSGSITPGGLYTAGNSLSPPDYYVTAAYGALIDSALVTVVGEASVSYIRVELADGRPFPDTTLTTDNDTTTFYCRAYDSGDDPLGDVTANWQIVDGDPIGKLTPAGGSWTVLELEEVGTARVQATYMGSIGDTSGVITCVAGLPVELTVAPDTAVIPVDSTLQFTASGVDADDNPTGPILTATWEVLGGIGSIDSTGLFTAETVGTGEVVAAGAGLTDTTGAIAVVGGEVAWIDVAPVGVVLTEGSSRQYAATGYDADSNFVVDLTDSVFWTTTDPSGAITSGGFYTAGHDLSPPDYHVIATYLALVDSGVVTVVTDGSLSYIRVELDDGRPFPDTTLTTDNDTTRLYCRGYDSGDNLLGDQSVTWEVTGIDSIGEVSPITGAHTTINLLRPGTGRVAAIHSPTVTDTTGVITCQTGQPAEIVVSPDTATVSADSTLQFTSVSLDQDGNETDPQVTPMWEVLGGIGTIDGSGLFGATTVGSGNVVAAGSGLADTTGTITVIPGEAVWIDVLPSTQIVIEDSSYKFEAYGYDADSNLVADFSAEAGWSTTDPSGSVTGSGLYTAGTDPSPPVYYVKAELYLPLGSLHSVRDSSAVTVLTSGSLEYVQVESFDGTPFSDTTLTTDNDTTRLYCRGYNSGDNLVGDFAVAWSLAGAGSIGAVDPGPATTTTLVLSRPGTSRVVGTYGPGMSDTTGTITCLAGDPAILVVSPHTATTLAGGTIQFATSTYDADGNPSTPVTIDVWDVLGGIGSISGTGLLTATTVGTGSVACSGGGLADTTGALTVLAGELSEIEIVPDSAEVMIGDTLVFRANGSDAYGNTADAGDLTWDVLGDIGDIDGAGTFSALQVGSGRITVASDINGIADTNRVVTVLASDLKMLAVTPDTATLKVTDIVQFTATGFDQDFQPAVVGDLTWQVLGGIGSIDQSGMFVAASTGVGYIAATSSLGGVGDTTSMIIVEIPAISDVPLGNAFAHAGASGVPVLGFKISNAFDGPEQLEGVTLRDASRGKGSVAQILSSIDSLNLYVDSNANGDLDPSDAFIAGTDVISSTVDLAFTPVMIGPGSSRTFLVTVTVGDFPCDGDSLDFLLLPSTDVELAGGTPLAGPDTINSLGRCILDGLVADQLVLSPTGTGTLTSESGLACVLAVDIPRNGYAVDTLEIFSVYNAGTADTIDLDSLSLYKDDGNGAWNGAAEEIYIGNLSFTGDQWELSGLSVGLAGQVSRFYVGVILSTSPVNGATLSLGIQLHALEMSSGNDGPIDKTISPVETITITSTEMVLASTTPIETRELTPGETTGPITAIKLLNRYAGAVHIDSVRFTNAGSDPGGASQDDLDSQIDAATLWLEGDGSLTTHGPGDSLIASGEFHEGRVVFSTGALAVPAGGAITVTVECTLNGLTCKNANLINFAVSEGADIEFSEPVEVSGDFPLKNQDDFPINTFPASSITVHDVAGGTIFGGETDHLVFDFELPRNGYAADHLRSLRIVSTGSSNEETALEAVRLWGVTDGLGSGQGEMLLGEFEKGDGWWQVSDLAFPLTDAHTRFHVTVDVATDDTEGGTLSFEIPIQGVRFVSGTDGPDDSPVAAGRTYLLFPANRITVIPIPADVAAVRPGALRAPVLTFALYNGYPVQTHVLEAVRLSNGSRSVSTGAFADYMLGQVSLYYDQNADRKFDDDMLIASGYFTDGGLGLSGLNVALPPESLSYFFVAASLPLDVIDSDTLNVTINEHSDFTFGQAVNINGELPLSRGGPLVIDGSVRDQYALIPGSAHTLSQGDTAVTLLAFRPALNGDRTDVLEMLRIANDADADTSDFRSLMLWYDSNADEAYQPTDSLLAQATYAGGEWLFDGIGLEIAGAAPVLFVTGDVTLWATPNSAFRPVIPIGGCEYASSNDGPLDAPLESELAFVISTSGLKLTYDVLKSRYSVGQPIEVSVHATNILPTTMYDVYCDITGVGEPGVVSLDSSSVARGVLAAGATADFTASYSALGPGTVHWHIQAFSSNPADSSAPVETESVIIQTVPVGVAVQMVSSVPTAVTRGQRQVFPLSLKYRHSVPSPASAAIELDSLRLMVEDEAGMPIDAGTVFSRMVLASGYTNLAILETLPAEPTVLLAFSQPTVVSPGDEQVLSLQVDIDSLAAANSFALVVDSADGIQFADFNTGGSVIIDPSVEFPLRTAACRISNPSRYIALSYVPGLSEYANYGQADVDILQLVLRHPGTSEDSQVQLTGLSFGFIDEGANVLPAAQLFNRVRLVRREAVLGQWSGSGGLDSLITMWLSAPPVLSPGEVDTLRLEASVKQASTHSAFELTIPDSTRFVLRDLSSGGTVRATGEVFPITSGITRLKYQAVAPEVCLTSGLPATVIAGSDSVALVEIAIDYPAGLDRSSIRVESVRVAVLDTLERAVDPYRLFDRIGFCVPGGQAAYESAIELDRGYTVFHLGPDGLTVGPDANVVVRLLADLEADAPFDNFILRMYREDCLAIVDATDPAHHPGFADAPECDAVFPFTTDMTRVLLPAGTPTIRPARMAVAIASPGQQGHAFFAAELAYGGAGEEGDLLVEYWSGRVLKRGAGGLEPVAGDQVFECVHLLADGEPIAADSSFAGDSLVLDVDDEYVLSSGDSKAITLTCDIKPDAVLGNYVVEFGDSAFAGFVDRDLATAVYAGLLGDDYPVLTGEVSVTAGDLAGSFCNWPNPFNPARQTTTIGFVLAQDAYVDIEIFTITGELVKTVVAGAHRSAGAHDEDVWAGTNDGGLTVLPGTYFLRITARYASGKVEDAKRKVAIIR